MDWRQQMTATEARKRTNDAALKQQQAAQSQAEELFPAYLKTIERKIKDTTDLAGTWTETRVYLDNPARQYLVTKLKKELEGRGFAVSTQFFPGRLAAGEVVSEDVFTLRVTW